LKSNLKFLEADVRRLPLEDNFLDVTVSTLSLHHWVHPEKALAEIHRLLKPGGRMFVFDLRRDMALDSIFSRCPGTKIHGTSGD
jgi:ubiquinone/menaquinone biosynthesis C-methylase UbiE